MKSQAMKKFLPLFLAAIISCFVGGCSEDDGTPPTTSLSLTVTETDCFTINIQPQISGYTGDVGFYLYAITTNPEFKVTLGETAEFYDRLHESGDYVDDFSSDGTSINYNGLIPGETYYVWVWLQTDLDYCPGPVVCVASQKVTMSEFNPSGQILIDDVYGYAYLNIPDSFFDKFYVYLMYREVNESDTFTEQEIYSNSTSLPFTQGILYEYYFKFVLRSTNLEFTSDVYTYQWNFEDYAPSQIWLVGTPQGWNIDGDEEWNLPLIQSENRIYEGDFYIPEGEFCFRFYYHPGNWEYYSIGAQEDDTAIEISYDTIKSFRAWNIYFRPYTSGYGKGCWTCPDWPGGQLHIRVSIDYGYAAFQAL